MDMITSMIPNLWSTLGDEVPAWVSVKRNKTSTDRTLKWLDYCLTASPLYIPSYTRWFCFALIFPLDTNERNIADSQRYDICSDPTKINLKVTTYRKDESAIMDDCDCYTCRNHTKTYINHLLNVHEMSAQILLDTHNTHHYLGFFQRDQGRKV